MECSYTIYLQKRIQDPLDAKRLKNVGAGPKILLDLYQKHIRSILEYSVPAWGPMISDENCDEVERVQKCAYKVIFGQNLSYKRQLELSNTLSLAQRRTILTHKFAVKCRDSQTFSNWFESRPIIVNTRNPKMFLEVPARCERWRSSPIATMTRILNEC